MGQIPVDDLRARQRQAPRRVPHAPALCALLRRRYARDLSDAALRPPTRPEDGTGTATAPRRRPEHRRLGVESAGARHRRSPAAPSVGRLQGACRPLVWCPFGPPRAAEPDAAAIKAWWILWAAWRIRSQASATLRGSRDPKDKARHHEAALGTAAGLSRASRQVSLI